MPLWLQHDSFIRFRAFYHDYSKWYTATTRRHAPMASASASVSWNRFWRNGNGKIVADKLTSFGLDVHQGLGKTGVVATLSAGTSDKKIALRADMDALFIEEQNTFAYRSRHDGKMHACGHEWSFGDVAGRGQLFIWTPQFQRYGVFIFQPARRPRRLPADDRWRIIWTISGGLCFWYAQLSDIPLGHFAVKSGAICLVWLFWSHYYGQRDPMRQCHIWGVMPLSPLPTDQRLTNHRQ